MSPPRPDGTSAATPPRVQHPKVVVLQKRTTYRKFVVEDHDPVIEELIARDDPTVRRLRRSHEDHEATVREVKDALERLDADVEILEGPLSLIGGAQDLVITIGGDGTLLAASHQIGPKIPLLGVNSAPDHSVGFFCGARKGSAYATIAAALEGRLEKAELTRMRVEKNGRLLHARVLNEALVCHASPAATSRYILRVTKGDGTYVEEEQRSSGVWVGPAAGSTAAQKSAGGQVLPLTSTKIQYVVREPYTPAGVPLKWVVGLVDEDGEFSLRSKMREAKIFLDGEALVFDVGIGDLLTMRRSDEPLTVLGLSRNGG